MKQGEKQGKEGAIRRKIIRLVLSISLLALLPGGPMANMDTIGILLVREMAVYAHYEYARGVNEIRIML